MKSNCLSLFCELYLFYIVKYLTLLTILNSNCKFKCCEVIWECRKIIDNGWISQIKMNEWRLKPYGGWRFVWNRKENTVVLYTIVFLDIANVRDKALIRYDNMHLSHNHEWLKDVNVCCWTKPQVVKAKKKVVRSGFPNFFVLFFSYLSVHVIYIDLEKKEKNPGLPYLLFFAVKP